MKTTIKLMLIILTVLAVNLAAQETKDTGVSAATYNNVLTNYIGATNLAGIQYQVQDPFFQTLGYYNNPEIQKLENEVGKLSSLYRRDQYGKPGFSSDKFQNLSSEEKKSLKNIYNDYSWSNYSIAAPGSKNEKDKSSDARAEEYFNKYVVPYLTGDKEKSINKPKLLEDIKKMLNQLFEMKESEKQKEVAKLEQQLKALQSTLAERKKSKSQIIDQRLNELIGLPNNLRW